MSGIGGSEGDKDDSHSGHPDLVPELRKCTLFFSWGGRVN